MAPARPLGRLPGAHADGVWALAATDATDRGHLLTGGMDGALRLWRLAPPGPADPDQGPGLTKVAEIERAHALSVVSLALSPAGDRAASTGLDGYLCVWDVDRATRVHKIDANMVEAWATAFSPRGSLLASTSQYAKVNLWSIETGQREMTISTVERDKAEARMVMTVAFSSDGSLMATGSSDGSVRVFDVETSKLRHKLDAHALVVRSLAFSPTEPATLATASDDHFLHIYDGRNNQLTAKLSGHKGIVTTTCFNPAGTIIASGGGDCQVRLWDRRARACIYEDTEHQDIVWGTAFCANGTRLASASDDTSLRIWDVAKAS